MGFFDEPEVRCAAGVGISALGIGALGIPLAADGCTEVVEKVVAKADDVVTKIQDDARDALCLATDPAAILLGSVIPFGPVTTLTMRYAPSICRQEDKNFLDEFKDNLREFMPLAFSGVLTGGVAAYLLGDPISKQDAEDFLKGLGEGIATALIVGSLAGLASKVKVYHTLHRVSDPNFHQRLLETIEAHKHRLEEVETFRIRRFLSPEQMDRLYQEINTHTKRRLQEL